MTATFDDKLGYDTLDIMVDVDDVVVPWFETVIAACTRLWGEPETPCVSWEMWTHWPGRTRDHWGDAVMTATHVDGLYTTVDPLPGSVEAINRLRWYGHRVHIVTARGFMENGENIRAWTHDYLANFGIGHDSVTFAKDKVAAQAELGIEYDWAIDDGLHNFEALTEAEVNVWLQDAPHNQHFETDFRVSSLWEFANKVLATTRYAEFKPRWVAGVTS